MKLIGRHAACATICIAPQPRTSPTQPPTSNLIFDIEPLFNMNHRMTNRNWESVSYATHGAIPEEGEIILLRYPISDIPFVQGPEPSAFAISAHASGAITDVTTASMVNRPKLHHVLVLGVSHNKHAEMIDLEFMPIMAYTSRPRGYPNSRERWDPDHWMTHEASDTQRLHHLPIPAVAWTPAASPSSSAPVLSFGGWLNTRKSWLAMELVAHEIPEVQIVTQPF